jgi:hypothetical protein
MIEAEKITKITKQTTKRRTKQTKQNKQQTNYNTPHTKDKHEDNRNRRNKRTNEQRKEIYLKENTNETWKSYHTTNRKRFIDESTERIDTRNILTKPVKLLTQTTTDLSNHRTKTHKEMCSRRKNEHSSR